MSKEEIAGSAVQLVEHNGCIQCLYTEQNVTCALQNRPQAVVGNSSTPKTNYNVGTYIKVLLGRLQKGFYKCTKTNVTYSVVSGVTSGNLMNYFNFCLPPAC